MALARPPRNHLVSVSRPPCAGVALEQMPDAGAQTQRGVTTAIEAETHQARQQTHCANSSPQDQT